MDDQVKCWCCGGELMDYPGEPWEPICDDCWARSTYLKPLTITPEQAAALEALWGDEEDPGAPEAR